MGSLDGSLGMQTRENIPSFLPSFQEIQHIYSQEGHYEVTEDTKTQKEKEGLSKPVRKDNNDTWQMPDSILHLSEEGNVTREKPPILFHPQPPPFGQIQNFRTSQIVL